MPKFSYVARDKTGNKVTGSEEAPTQDEVVSRLQAKEMFVVEVIPEVEKAVNKAGPAQAETKAKARRKHSRITSDDLMLFCRQLATLLGAGVTILKSIEIISRQVSSRKLYAVIKDLGKNMEGGLSLHEALAKHPRVFSELWVNLIESGEASGNLSVVLSRLASYLERNAAFRRKVISSLIYPVILMVAGIVALLVLTIKIIPTFAELFKGFDMSLPLLTQVLIVVSNFIRKFILIMIVLIGIGFYSLKKYIATKDGKLKYDKFKLRLPIFGEFFRGLMVERFSSELSTLIESGVPILYSLEIAEHSMGNVVMADIIRKVKEAVRDGKSLSQPLEKSGFFEPMVVQMVTVGEEIGELPQMFKRINSFYQEYVETFLARMLSLFEPIMLVFMGLVIGIIVIGIYLPIFKIAQIGGG